MTTMSACEQEMRAECTPEKGCSINGENISSNTKKVILYGDQRFDLQKFAHSGIISIEGSKCSHGFARVYGIFNATANLVIFNRVEVEPGTVIKTESLNYPMVSFERSGIFGLEVEGPNHQYSNNYLEVSFGPEAQVMGELKGTDNVRLLFMSEYTQSISKLTLEGNSIVGFISSVNAQTNIDSMLLKPSSRYAQEDSDSSINSILNVRTGTINIGTIEIENEAIETPHISVAEGGLLSINNFEMIGGSIVIENGTFNRRGGNLNIGKVSVKNGELWIKSYGIESVSSVDLNKSYYYQSHEYQSPGKAGSVSLSSGDYIRIPSGSGTTTGSYSGSSFNSYKK